MHASNNVYADIHFLQLTKETLYCIDYAYAYLVHVNKQINIPMETLWSSYPIEQTADAHKTLEICIEKLDNHFINYHNLWTKKVRKWNYIMKK